MIGWVKREYKGAPGDYAVTYYPQETDEYTAFTVDIQKYPGEEGDVEIDFYKSPNSLSISETIAPYTYFQDPFNPTQAELTLFELEFTVSYPTELVKEVFKDG